MADKKITELPFIDTLSGSLVGDNTPLQNTVIPLVLRGNTNQINIENFSKFVTAYSAHTGSAGNIFTGPQTINNNVTINGRLTVREVVAEYETASILFSTGSTKLGDEITDRHEFTGSTNITGSFIVNGANLTDFSASNSTLFTNYSSSVSESISSYSSSNSMTFTNLSSSNSTTFTNLSSSNSTTFTNLSSSNSTTFTNLSSSNSTTFTNYSSSTATTINGLSLGIGAELARVYQTTASLNVQTGSQDLVNLSISTYTGSQNVINSSVDSHILKQATQTGSQDLVNFNISTYTGSQNVINSSVDAHILKQSTQTGSQDLVNLGISSVTGSLIGITNTLMAFTAALDNTYATDAQLYQLYQATASIQAFTSSQDSRNFTISQITSSIDAHILKQATQTGSQDLVNLSISTYTGSQNVINSSVDAHILKQATQTGSQDLVNLGISSVTGSLIGITNGLMAFTAALDSTYATDAQLYQLYQATASLNTQTGSQNTINFNISVVTSSIDSHILKQATQTGSQDLVNLGISTFTGSLRSEVNLIEAYTASLKGAIEVSGQNVNVLGMITAQQFNVTYVSSSVMYQSGSTEFGDTSDDRHLFTGSLIVSGTLAAGTDETGYGRISFNESANTLRIQSSKNGTDCTPISFWSQRTGGTFSESMVISGSNLGLGVTPSAWQTTFGSTAFQFLGSYLYGYRDTNLIIGNNVYYDGTWKYYASSISATKFNMGNGGYDWAIAPSGTAGNAASFIEAMVLTPDGYLGIGKNSTSVSNGDLIGLLAFKSNDVSTNSAGAIASIRSYATADYNTGNVEGDMRFYVSNGSVPNGSLLSGNECGRFNKLGYLKASDTGTYEGATSAYHELRNSGTDYTAFITSTNASSPNGIYLSYTAASPNGTGNLFLICRDGGVTTRAEIRSNGGIANYQSNDVDLSDERVKSDITPLSSSWDEVKEYEIVSYKYIDQTHDDLNIGVIAQQIELVNPNLIDSGSWESGSGEPLKTVYNKDLYFTAIKALQEAMIRIEQLETKVAQLENK